jgi:hypothetical protein
MGCRNTCNQALKQKRAGNRASFDPFFDLQVRVTPYPSFSFSIMPLSSAQITAANEVINILCTTPAGPRTKRKLGEMFMDLVDKDDLPEYYEVRTAVEVS